VFYTGADLCYTVVVGWSAGGATTEWIGGRMYRDWLIERVNEVQDMIRDCENLGFHHDPVGSVEYTHYSNLVGMEVKLNAQIQALPIIVQSVRP